MNGRVTHRDGRVTPRDMSRTDGRPLVHLDNDALMPLPPPLDDPARERPWAPLSATAREKYECLLDDTCAVGVPRPASAAAEDRLVERFLHGLEKLFSRENNWTFLQPLVLTMEHCTRCQSCSGACHVFEASGGNELYRPTYRSEILRRLYFAHVRHGGLVSAWQHGTVELNWPLIARLAELAYRCNLCRRCAQACPIGADNGLVAHELRKLFSMEMGLAPKELHAQGSLLQLRAGSTTGMSPRAVKDNVAFIDEDVSERTGIPVRTPWDVEGADVLVLHNAGEIMAWPENPGAFALVLTAAGVNWTLSSELVGYDAVNYGLWYDDAQYARVAVRHLEVARRLKVKKILIGECGHAHKALCVIADRLLPPGMLVPRESALPFLRDLVVGGRLALDPARNDFPVTLHDPCNVVRLMGIVEPQRQILRRIAPRFREMWPHGVHNYCCGGGSGFAIMNGWNFPDWRHHVSGRKKLQQVLAAFADCLGPETPKYVCAPCSNCKGQLRDLFASYDLWAGHRVLYGGLVELVVNAMRDVRPGFIEWQWR